MSHALEFTSETDLDAVFVCATCGQMVGFNKSETSDPHAVKVGADWTAPANPDQWMSPCTQ
jgi:hypothetical protein